MVHVSQEMQRQEMQLPLLIGGATTSRAHTALKIEPQYRGPVVHVHDASRAVGVVGQLLNAAGREAYVAGIKSEYEQVRAARLAQAGASKLLPIAAARANGAKVDWKGYVPPAPSFTGVRAFERYPLGELAERIDWTPFFQAWELAGRFPAILEDDKVGEQARNLFADARRMLQRLVAENWLEARAVFGFFAANAAGDDVLLYADAARTEELAEVHFLRQQMAKSGGQTNHCLADWVAPVESGVADWIGAFAVTAGIGIESHVSAFEADHDDYSAIMLKALADRLAEALAERLHERVRKELWAYAPDEELDNEGLIAEKYRGIRPAPGYPACPDHTEKATIWELLRPQERAGISLTEHFAMTPTAAVSGFYLSHPDARYFGTGRIGRDQVQDYARRKGTSLKEAERWLSPVLAYDP
jgi:5-methyltetrahydrofolate--homocysteine methyltransferase